MYAWILPTLLTTVASGSTMPTLVIDPNLIPEFGLTAGRNPDGSGSCTGSGNVLIPCFCPPKRQEFIEKVNLAVASGNVLGTPITFDIDPFAQSNNDIFNRATTCLIVL